MAKKIFSFFSGAGLLDFGFETSGFEIVRVNEFHRAFLKAYKYSRAKLSVARPAFGYDSESIDSFLAYGHKLRELAEQVDAARSDGSLVGFIGGPPCPDFSVGGKNKGRHGENGRLSKTYVQLICEARPDFFLFENVKGLWRTKRHREFFEELKTLLWEAGYRTTEKLINSIEFGVPQDRDRIILLGFLEHLPAVADAGKNELGDNVFPWNLGLKHTREAAFSFLWPDTDTFQPESERPLPQGIQEELTVGYWFQKNKVEQHPNQIHCFTPKAGLKRFQTVDEGDVSRKSYKRLHRWRYSPTACYGNNEVHLHPYKPRRITVAEALAIQSLPPEFELPPDMSLSDMFKTVGNGVPLLAAKALASSVMAFLNRGHDENHGGRYSQSNRTTTEKPRLQLR